MTLTSERAEMDMGGVNRGNSEGSGLGPQRRKKERKVGMFRGCVGASNKRS